MTEFRELTEREYSSNDIENIRIRPEDKGRGLEDIPDNMTAYSYCHCEQIIGIVGVARVNDNTCEVWIILDECSKRYTREIHSCAFDFLHDLQQYYERIQAVVRTDWSVAIRFMERLGFEKEGLMRKFGPDGNDFYLYGRVR